MNRKNVIAGIWLIGLGILFLFNFIWPGILILIGLSMVVTAFIPAEKKEMPAFPSTPTPPAPTQPAAAPQYDDTGEPLPPILAEKADVVYRQSLLPETCPACGGPVKQNATQVVWNDDQTAVCPFCAARLNITPAAGS
jgi:hypothetical protein